MSSRTAIPRLAVALCLLIAALPLGAVPTEAVGDPLPLLMESTGWLVAPARRAELIAAAQADRAAAAAAFLALDPLPETPQNELAEGAARRRELALRTVLTPLDDRARLLFLHGAPRERVTVDCSAAFQPLELWRYETDGEPLILYQPKADAPWRLWTPGQGKGALYTAEMRGWMQDWHSMRGNAPRFDRKMCPDAKIVDRVTGTAGLWPSPEAPPQVDRSDMLAPPRDLREWALAAAATSLPDKVSLPVAVRGIDVTQRQGTRTRAQLLLELPPDAGLTVVGEDKAAEVRLAVEGLIETGGAVFEQFRMRFPTPPPAPGEPVTVAVARALRPGRYIVRLRVRDEAGGAEAVLAHELVVPALPPPPPALAPEGPATERLSERLARGAHAVSLLVPPSDVIFGNVRVQAVATGEGVRNVAFLVDGKVQLVAAKPPYSVVLDLPTAPREVLLRAEARDAAGNVLAADEVLVNQPRGSLRLDLKATPVAGTDRVKARVSLVVPEGRRVQEVTLRLNDAPAVAVSRPDYAAELVLPAEPVVFLTATATLDDGSMGEAVKVLRDRPGSAMVDVELVELLATLVDREGTLVDNVSSDELAVWQDGRRQTIQRVERASDLPLTVGLTLDVSGSMNQSLRQAQQAALNFLEALVGPRDRAFAVAFSGRPELVMPPTSDVRAVGAALESLKADGWTSLHDAIVFSLYHMRGIRDRRALVLLSDGDDTTSQIDFDTTLEHARASGVIVYCIGLNLPNLDPTPRMHLRALARETGGRAFFVGEAAELAGVYGEIAEELRRQVLVAYASDRPGDESRHKIELRVSRPGVETRSVRAYEP
jgi:Ca-activated chloride channel family protein